MKRLLFHYHMHIGFDMPVKDHHFTLKCLPLNSRRQHIEKLSYEVFPNRFISRSEDSFGNECIYGSCEEAHEEFLIDVKGEAVCGLNYYEFDGVKSDVDIYKYQTDHTAPGESIRDYHDRLTEKLGHEEISVRKLSEYYMKSLYADYNYVSGSTKIATTAEEAFSQGCGVCQDYAHVLIALLRMEQVPCRYVTGMMLGEGLSHAWVEYYEDGKWYGLDPTNGVVVMGDHIRIAAGRDYKDCRINQGVFTGCDGEAKQDQSISVNVEETESWKY